MFAKMFIGVIIIINVNLPSAGADLRSTSGPESDMLNLTSGSNCTDLGYPGTSPRILNGYEKGPGRCCFPNSGVGGCISMCLKNGEKDVWHQCPTGTCNAQVITSENQVWIDHLSAENVCKKSADCNNTIKEFDVKRVNMTLRNELKAHQTQDGNPVTINLTPDVKQVKMTLRNKLKAHQTQDGNPVTIYLTPGLYEIECTAEGGYREPSFTITSSGGSIIRDSKATLDLTSDERFVTCSVQVSDSLPKHVLKFKLKVRSVEPEISCDNVSASLGDRRVVKECTVVAPDITCKRVVWLSGSRGLEITTSGRKNPGLYTTCKSVGKDRIQTQLEVRDLTEEDFEDIFYIKVIGASDGDYQQGQKIFRKSLLQSKSSNLTASRMLGLTAILVTSFTSVCLSTV